MSFTRRIDMRNISRKGFLEKIQGLNAAASAYFGGADVAQQFRSDGTDTIVEWTPIKPAPVDVAKLADVMAIAVNQLNSAPRQISGNSEISVQSNGANVMANVTGASALGSLFRNHLADVKAQLAKASQEMDVAMGDLKDTASQATEMVKAVKAETADLKASLGLHSNGPEDA